MQPNVVLKSVGSCCILAASILIGLSFERSMKCRYLFFYEMRDAIRWLKQELSHRRTALPEALEKAAQYCHAQVKQLFQSAAEKAAEKSGQPFDVIWRESVTQNPCSKMLEEKELDILLQLSNALCSTDLLMQQTLLESYEAQFDQLSSTEKTRWMTKGSLYRKLSAAAGLFLILLLL